MENGEGLIGVYEELKKIVVIFAILFGAADAV